MKKQSTRLIKRALSLGFFLFAFQIFSQEKQVGDLADDFTLTNVKTGEVLSLRDFEGSIVLLDFFFYW